MNQDKTQMQTVEVTMFNVPIEASRRQVKAGRVVRQAGSESGQAKVKTGRTSKKIIEAGVLENMLVDLKNIQDELATNRQRTQV